MTDLSTIDTTIHIGSIAVHQPVAVFTDFIITGLCIYFYLQLKGKEGGRSTKYWAFFFLNLAIATFSGGCAHAFFAIHQGVGFKSFWLTMHLFNGLSLYAAQLATYHSVLHLSEYKKYWKRLYDLQLFVFIPAVFIFQNFLVVIIALVVGMVPIMILHFLDAKNEKASALVAYGILISFLTAIVHASKFSLHVYFNHLDIAHIFIMINLSVMYVGINRKQKTTVVSAI